MAYNSSNEDLNKARDDIIAAQDAANQATIDSLNSNKAAVAELAASARRAAQANARLNALGSNEIMAALGLAGNAYAAPTSGFSETSRIANDNSYRRALNDVNLEENSSLLDIMNKIAEARTAGALAKAKLEAEWFGKLFKHDKGYNPLETTSD